MLYTLILYGGLYQFYFNKTREKNAFTVLTFLTSQSFLNYSIRFSLYHFIEIPITFILVTDF